ncbi:hypothetical protein QZH41_010293 [Actinostola sp. cb2023]|nr:hypothetical protein QZH41_010293 [Actinostola sp. cb2023]
MSDDNQGYKHWLTCIDVLSRYAWVRPIKNKTAPQIIQAFQSIFKEGRQPKVLQTDQGTEFLNRHVQAFFKSQGIRHFVTYSDPKAQIVERFHRTIKNRLWRYFTAQNTQKYVDVLPEFVSGYNQAYHRSIRRSPDSVTYENAQEVWHTLYDDDVKNTPRRRFRFNVGDQVRMSKLDRAFKKGYLPNWTEEVFVIASQMQGTPSRYKLNEWDGDPIKGSFYEQELQRVTVRPEDSFRVETIVKRRRLGMSSLPHKESFYVRLPSNVVTTEHKNTAWDYVVPLPHALNFADLDEWTVAVASVFLPPLRKQNKFDNVFIYSNLVTGTLVGDAEVPLLCTVDMKAGTGEGSGLGGMLREPEQLMYCPLRVGYIESIRLLLNDEFGKTLVVFDRGQTVVVLHFLKKRIPMGERRLVLPSNASKELYPDNTGHTFTVRLPASLNYVPDDWEVGMVYMTIPTPEGRIEQLSPRRQIGVGKINPTNHTWIPKGFDWHKMPAEKYHSTENLVKAFNKQMHEVILKHVQNVKKGSCVVAGENELAIMRWTYTKGGTKQTSTFRSVLMPPGLYTAGELMAWINAQLSLIKIDIRMLSGTGPTNPSQLHTHIAYSFQVGSTGRGFTEGISINDASIMKRFEFVSNAVYDGKTADFQTNFNKDVFTAQKDDVKRTLQVASWVKIWMEEAENTVVLKQWTLDEGLHVVMSSDLVDYFGFPKIIESNDVHDDTTNDVIDTKGFYSKANPPTTTDDAGKAVSWGSDPPMVWKGNTWTPPTI